ncbi:hypothetical protein FP2506_15024 [Fulvimarina pelagi HTCC2506]|uniref:Uncharacterized protein n=1 Tax=Fulvimarina pelagi HTCC2506 TaxID=314231 RepID=Q0G3S5_9HYPH|nr:hypothetical protein [Fulvimarina pelagi]EAU41756.1 hypothetical protein FP2506_15024 [Fulvimarina pelagi HTCC2506]
MFAKSRQTRDNLITLIAAPTIWALHFLASYLVASVDCAPNVAIFEKIAFARWLILGITILALLLIGLIFRRSYGEWRGHGSGTVNDEDTAIARERFLEFSTVLLAGLSFIAVVFVALPAFFNVDCR